MLACDHAMVALADSDLLMTPKRGKGTFRFWRHRGRKFILLRLIVDVTLLSRTRWSARRRRSGPVAGPMTDIGIAVGVLLAKPIGNASLVEALQTGWAEQMSAAPAMSEVRWRPRPGHSKTARPTTALTGTGPK